MRRNRIGAAALLAGALLAAACEGNNLFPEEPIDTGGTGAGGIRGQVVAAGAGVAGAQVSVAGGPADTTDATGQYAIAGLARGTYRVSLQAPVGYGLPPGDSASRTVNLGAGQNFVLNWTLLRATGAP